MIHTLWKSACLMLTLCVCGTGFVLWSAVFKKNSQWTIAKILFFCFGLFGIFCSAFILGALIYLFSRESLI